MPAGTRLPVSPALRSLRARSLRARRDGDALPHPDGEAVRVLEDVRGNAPVAAHLARALEGAERVGARSLEIPSRRVVDLEVDDVVVHEREEEIVGVDADAAEHPARADRPHRGELVDNPDAEFFGDGHAYGIV